MPVYRRKTVIYFAIIAAGILIIYFIYSIRIKLVEIFMPFVIALFISYILMPFVAQMEKIKIARWKAIMVAYLFLIIAAVAIIVYFIPEIMKNIGDLLITIPDVTSYYSKKFNQIIYLFQNSDYPENIKKTITMEIQNNLIFWQGKIIHALGDAAGFMVNLFSLFFDFIIAMIIAFYFMKDSENIKKSVVNIFPIKWRKSVICVFADIHKVLSGFIQGQMITSLVVALLEIIGLSIAGVKYSFIMGVFGGIANIIPYFGPLIGGIPVIVIAFLQSPIKAAWAAIVLIVIQQIDSAYLSPRIIGGNLGLHPITTIFAILAGGEFFGIAGILLAVPAMGIIKALSIRLIAKIV